MVDPSFFRIFSFPLVRGDGSRLFPDPKAMVISADLARKYFGDEDPLGRDLTINRDHHFIITGVMENVPSNSTLRFDLAVPYSFLESTGKADESWNSNSIQTFVQLRPDSDPNLVALKIHDLVGGHIPVEDLTHSLKPLTNIHLYNTWGFGNVSGTAQYVYLFTVIALFVLIVACLNFMNLATARSSLRAREVGLRKVVGARRSQLIRQFYGETFLAGLMALVLALVLIILALPMFNELAGKSLSMNTFLKPAAIFGGIAVLLSACLVAGSYPAFFLSRFRPVQVLRSGSVTSVKRGRFRKALVVAQFTLSIGLICATGVVYSQLHYIQALNPGYDRDHVLCLPVRGEVARDYTALKREISRLSGVRGVTAASHRPSQIGSNSGGADWDGRDPEHDISLYFTWVDYDYLKTTGIELAAGRDYSQNRPSDETEAFVINESAAKIMGMETPVGARLRFAEKEGRIIGVARDFHFESLHSAIEPLVMLIGQPFFSTIMIRLEPGNPKEVLVGIENVWRRLVSEYPFDYSFLNDDFDAMYRAENRMGDVMTGFAVFALFIACLGLFGLAAFAAERRTREIGIRKVLGASTNQTVSLLCREFVILVAISVLIAWPLVGWLMNIWLADFAYRTDLPLDVFLWSASITMAIALLTVSSQALRAASINPVKALRHE